MSGADEEHIDGGATPVLRGALSWVAGVAAVAVGLVLVMHIALRPIPPDQEAPEGHFGEPCVACHTVSAGADPVELP